MSKVKCCWFHTPFFFTSFSSFFTIYPQKKLQNSCGNIYGKQNVRSENARKWIKFLKTCPSLKMPKVTLDLKSIHPCLWSVLKKFPSATFLRLHKCPTNLKMGPKHQAALKPIESAPPNENFNFWLKSGVGPPQARSIGPWFPFKKNKGLNQGFWKAVQNPSSKISAWRRPVGKQESTLTQTTLILNAPWFLLYPFFSHKYE